ncbi:MAG: M23 family metallopeptidase [Alphaproteobacteria bacterium]|nr:M23 family metallopeptidase [Alphaproteobacteria bacterium]
MSETIVRRWRSLAVVTAVATSASLLVASVSIAQQTKPTQLQVRPPQASATPNKPTVYRGVPTHRGNTATAAVRKPPANVYKGAVPGGEASAFAIDPAKGWADHLTALGVAKVDADAAAKVVEVELAVKPMALTSGRAMLGAPIPGAGGRQLENLRLFNNAGASIELQRGSAGQFALVNGGGAPATPAANTTQVAAAAPAAAPTMQPSADSPQSEDDPRRWRAPSDSAVAPRLASVPRGVPIAAGPGVVRVRANGNATAALSGAGLDAGSAQAAAAALTSVAPAGLNLAAANVEIVRQKGADGHVTMVAASIYDDSRRARIWWFAPKDQPEGFFDDNGGRVGGAALSPPIDTRISSPFGYRRLWARGGYAFHNGIDFEGRHGMPIAAAADGVVDYAGWYYNYGRTVRIVHNDQLATTYSHMQGFSPAAQPGTRVRRGDIIGYVGSTGRSTGPHVHFCVLIDGQFVDPMPYVQAGSGNLAGQDLVAFRAWQQRGNELSRGARRDAQPSIFNDRL